MAVARPESIRGWTPSNRVTVSTGPSDLTDRAKLVVVPKGSDDSARGLERMSATTRPEGDRRKSGTDGC